MPFIFGLLYEVSKREGENDVFVFHPTREQLSDFPSLMNVIEESDATRVSGICKIVPPRGWSARRKTHPVPDTFRMLHPVEEKFEEVQAHDSEYYGSFMKCGGESKNSLTWKEFKKLASTLKKAAPPPGCTTRAQLDEEFWKDLENNDSWYGADTEGTLYDDDVQEMRMANGLGTILSQVTTKIPGMNTPYLYFGQFKSMFPWHTEDADLYSINYLHSGHAKHWWAVAPEHSDMFEKLLSQYFQEKEKKCKAFTRHKRHLLMPMILQRYGVPYSSIEQNPNEFIITFPRGYHMGYNAGLNIAESTNFATDRWIDFGKTFRMCVCRSTNVHINMCDFVRKYRAEEYDEWSKYWFAHGREKDNNNSAEEGEHELVRKECKRKGKRSSHSAESNESIKRRFKKIFLEMSSWRKPRMAEERAYNESRAHLFTHCSVCQHFLPETLLTKHTAPLIPHSSLRFTPNFAFHKSSQFASQDVQHSPVEETLVTCDTCRVTVHEKCYPGGMRSDEGIYKCCRCQQTDRDRVENAACHVCSVRGGALVQSRYSSGASACEFVHVVCAISHRRTCFEESGEAFTLLPSKYKPNEMERQRLKLEEEYVNFTRDEQKNNADTERKKCEICDYLFEGLLVCEECVHEGEEDPFIAHSTCARAMGMRVEMFTFPRLASLVCHRHQHTSTYVRNGEEVWSGDVFGRVEDEDIEYSYHFIDSSISTGCKAADVTCCWCCAEEDMWRGAHIPHAPVEVRWGDGLSYLAYSRGALPKETYLFKPIGAAVEEAMEVSIGSITQVEDSEGVGKKKKRKGR